MFILFFIFWMAWTRKQQKMICGVEMPQLSNFTVQLLFEQFCFCSSPLQPTVSLHHHHHPLVPTCMSADGWAHLLQISLESERNSDAASLLLHRERKDPKRDRSVWRPSAHTRLNRENVCEHVEKWLLSEMFCRAALSAALRMNTATHWKKLLGLNLS